VPTICLGRMLYLLDTRAFVACILHTHNGHLIICSYCHSCQTGPVSVSVSISVSVSVTGP